MGQHVDNNHELVSTAGWPVIKLLINCSFGCTSRWHTCSFLFLSLLITYICNNIMISAYYDLAVLHYTFGVTRLTNMLLKEKITFLEDFFSLVSIMKLSKCKFPYKNQLQTQISALIELSPVNKTCQEFFRKLLLCGKWYFVKTEVLHGNGLILMHFHQSRACLGVQISTKHSFRPLLPCQVRYGKPSHCLLWSWAPANVAAPSLTCNSWGCWSCVAGNCPREQQDVEFHLHATKLRYLFSWIIF